MLKMLVKENIKALPQRSHGSASVSIKKTERGNRLAHLYQKGCAKVRLPKTYDQEHVEAVMINTSGGMTGADELSWQFTALQNSGLTVTTQACERVYRSVEGYAKIGVDLLAEKNSTLFWMPQETILYEHSKAHRKIRVRMDDNARVLIVEPLIMGRTAMGESLSDISFLDNWTIAHEDQMVHMEATRFCGDIFELQKSPARLDGNIAIATVLLLGSGSASDLEAQLLKVRSLCSSQAAASFWKVGQTGKLIVRIVANDGYELRKTLIPIVQVLANDATLPKCWTL